jgi:two-component system sensor histidine kinase ChvG
MIARVMVEDEGPGIPPGNLESIFERFYTERPVESFGRNSGLGLSIARQIIEAAGGRIYAENRSADNSQGHGARLIVELPLSLGET